MSDRLIIFTDYMDIFLNELKENIPYDILNEIYLFYMYNWKIYIVKSKYKQFVLPQLLFKTKSINKSLINKPIYNLCNIEDEKGYIKYVSNYNFKGWVIRNHINIEYNDHLRYLIRKYFIFYKCTDCDMLFYADELFTHLCVYNCKNIIQVCHAFKLIDRNTGTFYMDHSRNIKTLKNLIEIQKFSKCIIKALKVYLISNERNEMSIIKFVNLIYSSYNNKSLIELMRESGININED